MAGCYTLQPAMGGVPPVGSKVAFDVNDAGRVGLGGALGPEIAQVEGRLLEKDSTGYLVAISNVRLLRGGEQVWAGEQVRIKPEFVGNSYEKRFSAGRSVALGAAGAGGIAAFFIGRSLLGGGSIPGSEPPPDSAGTRLWRP